MKRSVICLSVLLSLSALAGAEQPSAGTNGGSVPAPATSTPAGADRLTAADLMQRSGGSLLRASILSSPDANKIKPASISFFTVPEPEPKTIKKHDLVTIIIREEAEMTSDGSTDLKKNADFDAKLEQIPSVKVKNGALSTSSGLGSYTPELKMNGNRNFKGEATVDRTDSFNTRISAEVIDVKPNGTFAIQARKRIKHDEEEQEYIMTGVCRAADLTADNTVLSWQIHDMDIVTTHKGAVSDTNKRGFIPRLMDFVNPF